MHAREDVFLDALGAKALERHALGARMMLAH
jgi:hypothetical protein